MKLAVGDTAVVRAPGELNGLAGVVIRISPHGQQYRRQVLLRFTPATRYGSELWFDAYELTPEREKAPHS